MTEVLRNGVLDGLAVLVAGAAADRAAGAAGVDAAGAAGEAPTAAATGAADAVASRCAALGATIVHLTADLDDEDGVAAAVAAAGPIDVVVCDAAPAFHTAGAGVPALRAAVDGAWNAVRAVVASRWAHEDAREGGKVVLIAPPADAGEAAEAAGAALENAARTLSVEWARFGVRVVALRPATGAPDEIAELVAFVASPGGDYFSGCAFSLR